MQPSTRSNHLWQQKSKGAEATQQDVTPIGTVCTPASENMLLINCLAITLEVGSVVET